MKRWLHASEDVDFIPERLRNLPYVFTLNSVNSTYNDDILEIAEHWGATKVKYQEVNPKTGNLFREGYWKFAVPSEKAAQNILDDVKKAKIPTHQNEIQVVKTDWNNNYNIWIDDYEKGKIKIPFNSQFKKPIESSEKEDFIVDFDLSKMDDDWWAKQEKKRLARELADEADYEENINTATIESKKYSGIWYGAKKNPITVKELLDKIIAKNGIGFTVLSQKKFNSDNLLDSAEHIDIYLADEEKRGRFKLDSESIDYLISNLADGCWMKSKLESYVNTEVKASTKGFKKINGTYFVGHLVDALKQLLPKNCWPKNTTNKDGIEIRVQRVSDSKLRDATMRALDLLGYDVYDIEGVDDEGYQLAAVKGDAFAKLIIDVGDYFNNGTMGYIDIKVDNGNVVLEPWYEEE